MTSRELAAIAAAIPSPVDPDGRPCRAYVTREGAGYRVVFGQDFGRVLEPVGPTFERPRAACRLAELLTR